MDVPMQSWNSKSIGRAETMPSDANPEPEFLEDSLPLYLILRRDQWTDAATARDWKILKQHQGLRSRWKEHQW